MQNNNNTPVVRQDDYTLLLSCLKQCNIKTNADRVNAVRLKEELEKATIVTKHHFPSHVVRLNSVVKIKSHEEDRIMQIKLVTPDKADIKSKCVSVMAPIGTALIGFPQGKKIEWQVPSGAKTFTILEVINDEACS